MSNIKKIVIVGGGTAGWMSAACLARVFTKTDLKIELIESPDVPTVGVGEATIPSIIDFMKLLGIDFKDFIQKTDATFKLAIQFKNWKRVGHSYWHQFGSVGTNIDGVAFYQHWLKAQIQGGKSEFTDYSPSIAMAKHNKFVMVANDGKTPLSGSKFAWHFDAGKVAEYLAEYSLRLGVQHTLNNVDRVNLSSNGFINSVSLDNNQTVAGDFFIDCSGSRSLLLGQALRVGFTSWKQYLPCDRAVFAQTENAGELAPYTLSMALDNGWQWRIPLQTRTGNGYVYSGQFCDEKNAEVSFLDNLTGSLLTQPKHLSFDTGCRKKLWSKNCLAVGLSSGFLEPLESTSIHLIVKAITQFSEMFPSRDCDESTVNEYNRILLAEYESIRDFIVLHYCTTQRSDSDFWNHCRQMTIPDSLKVKLELFMSQGRLFRNEFDLFSENSWYAVLEGMGLRPRSYHLLVDNSNVEQVNTLMSTGLERMQGIVKQLPTHQQFIIENQLNRM